MGGGPAAPRPHPRRGGPGGVDFDVVNRIDFQAVALPLGLLLGAILNGVVLRTAVHREQRRPGEPAFLALIAATLVYDLAGFGGLFARLVYVPDLELRSLVIACEALQALGLALIPSLLLFTALGFVKPGKVPRWVNPLVLVPMLTLHPALVVLTGENTRGLMPVLGELLAPFALWMFVVCSATAYVAYEVSQRERRPTTAQLTTAMAVHLGAVALLFLATYTLGGFRLALVGDYLNLLALLSPNAIGLGLALYVYRYPDVGDAIQRGLYNMSLALLVLCIYFFVIRETALRLGRMQLRWEVLEAMMLVAAVWAFHPLRNLAAQLYDSVFLTQVVRYQETFRRMGRGLSEAYVPDLPFVLSQAAGVIQEALGAETAMIFLVKQTPEGIQITHGHPKPYPKEIPQLLERTVAFGEHFVDRFELEDRPLAALLDGLDADGAFPFFRDGSLAGLVVIGHRSVDRRLAREEKELLSFVGHVIDDALQKNALVEQKVRLEREIAASERMTALGRLAAGVAHEIKNPLSTIKSIIEVMREEVGQGSPMQEDLEVVSEEIARLDSTVKNLLEFIRPDERKDKLVSVESVLTGVVHILDYEARKNKVVIATQLSPKIHYVRGLSEDLKSIFFNLVLNAIQAMAEKGGTLTVTTQTDPGEGGEAEAPVRRVLVEVRDTGPGIPESRKAQIFKPFYTEGKDEGTGLGLAIVRQKVATLEGEIGFDSGPGGTTFQVRLPVAGRDFERRKERAAAAAAEGEAAAGVENPSPEPAPPPAPEPVVAAEVPAPPSPPPPPEPPPAAPTPPEGELPSNVHPFPGAGARRRG